jgi:hypothetical protein
LLLICKSNHESYHINRAFAQEVVMAEQKEYTSRPKPKLEDSPLLKQTAAEAYGWPSDWRTRLIGTQEVAVFGLQLRLIREATGSSRSGELKDLAVALGVAVDKLQVLRPDHYFDPAAKPTVTLVTTEPPQADAQ